MSNIDKEKSEKLIQLIMKCINSYYNSEGYTRALCLGCSTHILDFIELDYKGILN